MKLLVLSNVSGSVDKVVDIIGGHHNITAKESGMSTSTIAERAAEQLNKGGYAAVIIAARDPIGAGVMLNKQDGVVAAVCGSVEDAKLARDNGANAIVIRDLDSEELRDIVSQAVSGGMIGPVRIPQIRIPELKTQQMLPAAPKQQLAQQDARQKVVQRKQPRQEMQEESRPQGPRSNTLLGKIKDYLGIL